VPVVITKHGRMTALLLDTHIWLWYAEGDADRLLPSSVKKLEQAAPTRGLVLATRDEAIAEYGDAGHVLKL
jgi:hypothetical protein